MEINIKVDKERMKELVTIDEYLLLLDGDIRTMVNVLSQFVLNDSGTYLDKKEGRKIIGSLTIEKMNEVVGAFTDKAEDSVVPPSKGAV